MIEFNREESLTIKGEEYFVQYHVDETGIEINNIYDRDGNEADFHPYAFQIIEDMLYSRYIDESDEIGDNYYDCND